MYFLVQQSVLFLWKKNESLVKGMNIRYDRNTIYG